MTSINTHLSQLDLDRQHLHKIRQTFFEFNQLRLRCTRDNLAIDQTIFIDALPLLLHFNHPMLPGYVSRDAPAGIEGFTPDKPQIQLLKTLAKSFQTNEYHENQVDILSVFIMGSVGTIAQHRMSDIDIWVCHRPDLDSNNIDKLKQKCEGLKNWATSLRLEVSLFVMNHEDFSSGQQQILDKESSGSTQHYLLLDEFYRTSIHIAGLIPLWFFINKEQEHCYETYAEKIIDQRFLPERQFIDFGQVPAIPSSEFISSAIWQLYKSIESPHKSLLKLMTLEAYVRRSLNANITSDINKKNLHEYSKKNIKMSMQNSDPYLNLYYFLEDYLIKSEQHHRLQILRRCFYFKVNKKLSIATKSTRSSWQYCLMKKLTDQWGWTKEYIAFIDKKDYWKTNQVAEEKQQLVNEINHSYHFIVDFFRSTHSDLSASTKEINILGRKLHAAFSKKSGKIEWLNPSISKDIHEDNLFIHQTTSLGKDKTDNIWQAIDKNNTVLLKNKSLLYLLCWLNCNNVMTSKTFLKVDSNTERLLYEINQWLISFIPKTLKPEKHDNYKKKYLWLNIGIYIDIDKNNIDKFYNAQKATITTSDIPINHAEMISVNSWNEVIHTEISDDTLPDLINYYCNCVKHNKTILEQTLANNISVLKNSATRKNLSNPYPEITVYCKNPVVKKSIDKTLFNLFKKIDQFFSENPNGRYIFSYGESDYLLYFNKDKSIIDSFHLSSDLYHALKSYQKKYSAIVIDSNRLKRDAIAKIVTCNKSHSVQVFFYHRAHDVDVYIFDENSSLYQKTLHYDKNHTSLKQLNQFLRAVSDRRLEHSNISSEDINPLDIFSIEFYQLHDLSHGWETERSYLNSHVSHGEIGISASIESVKGHFSVTLYCSGESFSTDEHHKKVFYKLGLYLLYLKQHRGQSNFYIADIDLSPCQHQLSNDGKLQTTHYLQVQERLEKHIYRALSEIKKTL